MTDLERLTTALEFLKANEWGKGEARELLPNGTYSYCAEGVLRWSLYPEWNDAFLFDNPAAQVCDGLIRKLDAATKEITNYVHAEIYVYNDHRHTTKDDIVKVFEKAIEKEKASA